MKTELRYGIIFAGVVVVYVMIEHVLGFNTVRHDIGQYTRLAGVLVPIIAIVLGVRAKRRELNGQLTFGQGVKTGFLIAVIQTTLTTLWFLFYGSVINPEFVNTMLEFERTKMTNAGSTTAEINSSIGTMRTLYSFPYLQLFQEVIGVIYGLIVAVLAAAIFRRRAK